MRLRIFGKKDEMEIAVKDTTTDLDKLYKDDKETRDTLADTLFLDPRKVGMSTEEAAENAKKFEKAKELTRAAIWYRIAGSLALYEKNPKKVEEYFNKAAKLSPEKKYPVVNNAEKAVAAAQEYYKKFLKP